MSSSFTNGAVLFSLLVSTLLTIPSALVLVWLYVRAVRSAMGRRTSAVVAPDSVAEQRAVGPAPSLELVQTDAEPHDAAKHAGVLRRALRGPWRSVLVYAVAGLCFGLTTSLVWLRATQIEFSPVRVLVTTIVFAWPVVLATNLLTAPNRGTQLRNVALYALVLGLATTEISGVTSAASFWLIGAGPPSLLLLAFFHRKVRTVGPLLFTFMS